MATKAEPEKLRPMTVRDLSWVLAQCLPEQIVYLDVCEACEAKVLSFEGPDIECPVCTAKITIRPMILQKKA